MKIKIVLLIAVIIIFMAAFYVYSGNTMNNHTLFLDGFVHGFFGILIIVWLTALLICSYRSWKKSKRFQLPFDSGPVMLSISMIALFSGILLGFHYRQDWIITAVIIPLVIISMVFNVIYMRKIISLNS
ncbi:MAG: hypothetical protein JXR46_07930 [Calditrichaceae bacterium]|nr:hypothetical protein [Calditrichaceae bacterium]MBN2708957.1 hypothetical protein [Calditrichaceae bacterium]RQV97520.1 MAG: hypothetical protein EH224_00430 [Calditrichota bacterium]